jgi:hypothetical protein
MADDSESGGAEHDFPSAEPGGMKARMTSDGKAAAVPLTPEEAGEMRRRSDEWDERLADLLTQEANYLDERFLEVLATGTTTIRSPEGTWTATLQRSRWRDGWLISEVAHPGGGRGSGRTRISRKYDRDQLRSAITLQIAIGMLLLRET